MTNYQTIIQKPHAIRFGSAKIEVENDSSTYVDLGAVKGLTIKVNAKDSEKYEPDNAPPREYDPLVESMDISFTMEEVWNVENWKLLRGNSDTYSAGSSATTIGIDAGTEERPYRKLRITNTTPGEAPVQMILTKCKYTSQLDLTFPADSDRATALGLPVTFRSYVDTNGFGTLSVPNTPEDVSISPASISVAVDGTQQITVTGGTAVAYGIMNAAVAAISDMGLVTGVTAGATQALITVDGREFRVAVVVTGE